MIKPYKLQSISAFQLFALLFVSRILVSLTYIPSLNFQQTNGDLVLSAAMSVPFMIISFLPAVFYLKKHDNENLVSVAASKNKALGKCVSVFYFVWFIFSAGFNVARFVYFASTEMSPTISAAFLCILIIGTACYGAYLGMQSLGRVAAGFVWIMLLGFGVIFILSVPHFHFTNFSPVFQNSVGSNLMSAITIAANTSEITALLFIAPKMREKIGNAYVKWSLAVGGTIVILYFFAVGCLGNFAVTQSYPVFTLSQIAGVGVFQRMDAVHTSVWILALFLKTAMFISCAVVCINGIVKKKSFIPPACFCAVCAVGAAVLCLTSFVTYWNFSARWVTIGTFLAAAVLVPLIFCFIKKEKGQGNNYEES